MDQLTPTHRTIGTSALLAPTPARPSMAPAKPMRSLQSKRGNPFPPAQGASISPRTPCRPTRTHQQALMSSATAGGVPRGISGRSPWLTTPTAACTAVMPSYGSLRVRHSYSTMPKLLQRAWQVGGRQLGVGRGAGANTGMRRGQESG